MSKVTYENRNTVCRTCLTALGTSSLPGEKYNIHAVLGLSECMLECTTIKAMPLDDYPKFVCRQCYNKLRSFYEFRCMSLRSNQVLSDLLNSHKRKKETRRTRNKTAVNEENEQSLDWLQFEGVDMWKQKPPLSDGGTSFTKSEQVDDKNMVMASLIEQEEPITTPVELETLKIEVEPEVQLETEIDSNDAFPLHTNEIKVDVINMNENFDLPILKQNQMEEQDTLATTPDFTKQFMSHESDTNDDDYSIDKSSPGSENSASDAYSIPHTKRKKATIKTRQKSTPASAAKRKREHGNGDTPSITSAKRPRQFHCERCPRRCVTQENLDAHMRTHEGLKPFECKECKHAFNKAYHYRVHMREVHAPVKQEIVCSYQDCGRVFTRESSYKLHFRSKHSEKHRNREPRIFVCEQCGRTFRNVTKFKEHTYKHSGIESYPYKCDECGKRFNKSRSYKEHLLRHAGIKEFVCPYCGMKKTTRHELRTHINYHTKEKQWPCKLCPMVFNSSANLGIHDRVVHKGIKRYACRFCDQSFGKRDTWRHHEMRHTGEKPHGCEICGRRFIQAVALRTHQKTHNKFEHKKPTATQSTPKSIEEPQQEVATACLQIVTNLTAAQSIPQ